jgi:hypothetical protein
VVATGRETTLQLPPAEPRSRGLFVDVAGRLSPEDTSYQGHDRLGQGVQHTPWGCAPLKTGNLDCSADVLLNGTGPAFDAQDPPVVIGANVDTDKIPALLSFDALVEHPSFKVVDGLTCSTISFPDANSATYTGMSGRLLRRMRTLMSAALTGELVTGWASGGPSLTSEATTLAASANMTKAAQSVEGHLAAQLLGNRGVVFIPPALLHYAIEIGWVNVEGGALMTSTGHRVVSDAGHDGTLGPTTPAGGEHWVFASGDVSFRTSDTMLLGDGSETLNITTNLRERLAEAYAQLAFDPCPVAATLVTIA